MSHNKEPSSNIGLICPVCAKDRADNWQLHHKELVIRNGDYVKVRVEFSSRDQEWMWLEVQTTKRIGDKEEIHGVFRNDAVFGDRPRDGDPATILRTDIADYCEQGDFDNWEPWRDPSDVSKNHTRYQIN